MRARWCWAGAGSHGAPRGARRSRGLDSRPARCFLPAARWCRGDKAGGEGRRREEQAIARARRLHREPSTFRGVQGTAVVGIMGLTVASTGANEKTLKRVGIPYTRVYTHANNHAGYYPGALCGAAVGPRGAPCVKRGQGRDEQCGLCPEGARRRTLGRPGVHTGLRWCGGASWCARRRQHHRRQAHLLPDHRQDLGLPGGARHWLAPRAHTRAPRGGAQHEQTHGGPHAQPHTLHGGAAHLAWGLAHTLHGGRARSCAQVGEGEGVEKRVDVVAMAMQKGGTVYDLEEAELCYAPQVRGGWCTCASRVNRTGRRPRQAARIGSEGRVGASARTVMFWGVGCCGLAVTVPRPLFASLASVEQQPLCLRAVPVAVHCSPDAR